MERILAPFNPRKELVDINRHPANGKAYSSVVLLADSVEQTRIELRYGLNDQLIALELNSLGVRIHRRFLHPGEDDFKSVGDLLLRLDEPLVYKIDQAGARRGYLAFPREPAKELHLLVGAAHKKMYRHLFLENFETQYDTLRRFDHFNGVDIVFQK